MPPKSRYLRPHEERRSYARTAPAEPPPGSPGLGDSFLIVCEGEVTELRYLECLRETLQLSSIEVCVVHPSRTDAPGLVQYAIDQRDRVARGDGQGRSTIRHFGRYDHIWVVFDTDTAFAQGHLATARSLANREGIHLAPSTPCVEFWLLLHFRHTTAPLLTSAEAERALGDCLGFRYQKSREAFPRVWRALKASVLDAVSNAAFVRNHHETASTPPPPNPSTDLDLLVTALNQATRPEMRLRPHTLVRG